MPAKKVTRVMIIRAEGGGANPAKLGQKLGPFGIGGKFCQEFNLKTAERKGEVVPCILTIYEDTMVLQYNLWEENSQGQTTVSLSLKLDDYEYNQNEIELLEE